MKTKSQILSWHNQTLEILLELKRSHSAFTFAPRLVNKNNRLAEGYWFQGDDTFVLVGLSKCGDKVKRTRAVGLLLSMWKKKEIHVMEIKFTSFADTQLGLFLRAYVTELQNGFVSINDTIWHKTYEISNGLEANLRTCILEDWTKLTALAEQNGLKDELVFSESEYQKAILRIEVLRTDRPITERVKFIDSVPIASSQKSQKLAKSIDWLALHQENTELGGLGEQTVIDYEKARLAQLGYDQQHIDALVIKVHDSEGYDIKSFNHDTQQSLFIEVKTTRGALDLPFFISENELQFGATNASQYEIWRIYKFVEKRADIQIKKIPGNPRKTLDLTPKLYSAVIKPKNPTT